MPAPPAQVLVRRGNNADIHLGRASGAHFHDLVFLDGPEDFDLERERHLSDFIEEERAAIGAVEQPALRELGTSERAFDVAKEFTSSRH